MKAIKINSSPVTRCYINMSVYSAARLGCIVTCLVDLAGYGGQSGPACTTVPLYHCTTHLILIRGLGAASHMCHCKQQESNKDKIWSVIQNIRSRDVSTLETKVLMRDVASPWVCEGWVSVWERWVEYSVCCMPEFSMFACFVFVWVRAHVQVFLFCAFVCVFVLLKYRLFVCGTFSHCRLCKSADVAEDTDVKLGALSPPLRKLSEIALMEDTSIFLEVVWSSAITWSLRTDTEPGHLMCCAFKSRESPVYRPRPPRQDRRSMSELRLSLRTFFSQKVVLLKVSEISRRFQVRILIAQRSLLDLEVLGSRHD